jgi:anti-anti-sigma regulatory factor
VLAAIIVIALKGLFLQFKDIPKYWRLSGTELSVWIVTFVAVVILDVGYGLVVGVAYGLLTVIGRTQAPYNCILGRLPNSTEYKDKSVCKTEEIEGVKIYRFENALYYANKDYFQTSLYEKSGCDPKRLKNAIAKCKNKREAHIKKDGSEEEAARLFVLPSAPIHHVVLDCSAVTYTDAMGVSVLRTVFTDYKEVKVEVFFAGLCEGVREMLEEGGFYEKCTPELLFPTVHDAVISALDNFPDQQKPLLHNVIDAPYYDQQASSLAQKPSIQAGVEELQIEVPVNKNMAHLKKESAARSRSSTTRSRSSTNRSRANTVDGYHNPALVVDDVMDLDELEGENNANDADMAGVITSF